MLILGIDTSTKIGAIGLVKNKKLIGEINLCLNQRHSERIMLNIKHLLRETQYEVEQLTGLAVTLGPGSFTGLRIGVTTIKTMAQFLDIPVTGISTLDVLAYNLLVQNENWVLPVIDASHSRVYTSLYYGENSASELINIQNLKKWKEQALTLNKLENRLKDIEGEIYVIGNAVNSYRDFFYNSDLNFNISSNSLNISRGAVIAEIGCNNIQRGQYEDLYQITPNYLKKAQARRNNG